MAKITDFEDIELSSLSNDDVFHIIDLSGASIIGSRKLKYETLKQGIDRDIEKVQIIQDCSYLSATKTLEISVGLSDGSTKVLSINMEELNIYHAGDGLSTLSNDDNTFIVDWSKVSQVGHKHFESDITDFGSYLSSSEKYLTANALDSVSSNWDTAYSRVSSITDGLSGNIGTLAYKNEISASEVCGYTDTTYSVLSNGLSIDSDNKISLKIGSNLSFDSEGNLSANEGRVYTAGNGLKLENDEFSISDDYIKRDEVSETLALSSISSICGENITVSDGKLSACKGNTYYDGKAIDIDSENKINIVLSDLINETSSNISVINDTLYVEPSTAKVTYITWK